MAIAPTLYDFRIGLSNVDRSVDKQLSLKVARHPSETLERLWLRVLAYCWHYDEKLAFGPGLSDPDAPDLEMRDDTGQLTKWIRVGKADPPKVAKVMDQNPKAKVALLFESPAKLDAFLQAARQGKPGRLNRAELAAVDPGFLSALCRSDERRIEVVLTLVGDHFYVGRGGANHDGILSRGFVEG